MLAQLPVEQDHDSRELIKNLNYKNDLISAHFTDIFYGT